MRLVGSDGAAPGPRRRDVAGGGRAEQETAAVRLRAEESLRLHSLVLERMREGVSVSDEDGIIVYTNPAEDRMFGYEPGELVGRHVTVQNGYPPEENALRVADVMAQLRARGHWEGEWQNVRKDGTPFVTQARITALELGGRPFWVCVQDDVTARRREETARRVLADVGALLAASLDHGVAVQQVAELLVPALADWCAVELLDAGGRLRLAAAAHADPARLPLLRELRSRYPSPPDAPLGSAAVARTGRAELHAEITDAMLAAAARDERHLDLLRALGLRALLLVPLTAHGRAFGVLSLAAQSARRFGEGDVALAEELARRVALAMDNARLLGEATAARARAERGAERAARLQAVTSALSGALTPEDVACVIVVHGVQATGADGGSLAALVDDGAAFATLTTVGMREAIDRFPVVRGRPLSDAVLDRVPVLLRDADEWRARYPEMWPVMERTGHVALAALPVAVGERVLAGLTLTFREPHTFDDETRGFLATLGAQCGQALERARLYAAERGAREEAERARAEAEAASRAKSDFLAVMSHELRTPLNAIGGYAELMELGIHGPLTEAQQTDLARVRQSERQLLGLINEVLNYVRVESGAVRYELADVEVDTITAAAAALMLPQARVRGQSLVVVPAGLRVRADPDKAQQILLNLLSNAVKFTPAGGRIEVTSERRDAAAVAVRVRDSGIGIPPGKLESIFEPFVQVGRSLHNPQEGAGLGLAISRDLARGMGGELSVQSTLGLGSTFTLALPAAE